MSDESRVRLRCTVRGCGRELSAGSSSFSCLGGHSFDLARSGYLNLLQVLDRRSNQPGDGPEVVAARRRWMKSGRAALLSETLLTVARELGLGPHSRVLDVGCGEGSFLGELQAATGCEAWGVDISRPAIEAAARRWPAAHWIVCNADLDLPFAAQSFELVLSITSRRNASEFARVLAPGGAVLFVVPAEDDQRELRALLHGEAYEIDRMPGLESEMGAAFGLQRSWRLSWLNRLDREAFGDLLATAYRGARDSQRARLEQRDALEVTSSYRLALFRGRTAP